MELLATYDLTENNHDHVYDLNKPDFQTKYISTDLIEQESENIQAIRLSIYPRSFLIEPSKTKTNIKTKLIFDRSNGIISQLDLAEKNPSDHESQNSYSGFLGIINILDKSFLLMVKEIHRVGKIENSPIYQIANVDFIPFESESENSPKMKEILGYQDILNRVFSIGFYFSYDYDLTLSKNKISKEQTPDKAFLWNEHLFKDIISQKIDESWLIPVIQGFFGTFSCKILEKKLDFFLITRRSNQRAGTRYNARGVDDDGNVANFCETEQFFYFDKICCSHLQIRGSVPAFWGQRGLTAQTKITRSFELSNGAFVKHFNDIVVKRYDRVLCVNLMAKGKPQEQMITEAYESLIKTNNLPEVRYEYFDFHHACKGQKFEMVNPLVKKLQLLIENFRFFAEDFTKKTVFITQKGIVRTNCLDCLDRTNFFMTKVAALMFNNQMKCLGVDLTQIFGEDILLQLDNNNINTNHIFIQNFKNIWADNGDYISKFYTGTGSTHTNITRSGKRDFFGLIDHGMKSVGRFYKQNFEDNYKQEAIDIILGQHTETVNVFNETIERELKLKEREFAEFDELILFTATWNMSGFIPPNSFELATELFDIKDNPNPDIFIVSLQEIFNPTSNTDSESLIELWTSLILSNLSRLDEENPYIFIKGKEAFGCLTLIFSHQRLKTRINKVSYDTIKFGYLGNRGAVLIKFYIDDTSFCFMNCQLDIGPQYSKNRLTDINEIHARGFQSQEVGKTKEEKIDNLDYRFLIGDLNFSINLPEIQIRKQLEQYDELIRENNHVKADDILNNLMIYDEFIKTKNFSDCLIKYQEPKTIFPPTAKYEPFSTIYKENFIPCWSDRILVAANEGCILKQYFYARKEYVDSSHRPVVGYYTVEVKKVDKAKKEEITQKIYEKQKAVLEEANKEEEKLKNSQN